MKNKKNLIKVALVLIAALIISTLALTSCSNDSAEPEVPDDENGLPSVWPSEEFRDYNYVRYYETQQEFEFSYEGDQPCYYLFVDSGKKYDYAVVRVESSDNITIKNSFPTTIRYSEEDQIIPIYFDAPEPFEEMILDWREAPIEKINVFVDAYQNGELVETVQDCMYVLSSPYNIYLSSEWDGPYYPYAKSLYDDGIITWKEFRYAIHPYLRPDYQPGLPEMPSTHENVEVGGEVNVESINMAEAELLSMGSIDDTINFFMFQRYPYNIA